MPFENRGRLQGKSGGELHVGEGSRAAGPEQYWAAFIYIFLFLSQLYIFGAKRKGLLRATRKCKTFNI